MDSESISVDSDAEYDNLIDSQLDVHFSRLKKLRSAKSKIHSLQKEDNGLPGQGTDVLEQRKLADPSRSKSNRLLRTSASAMDVSRAAEEPNPLYTSLNPVVDSDALNTERWFDQKFFHDTPNLEFSLDVDPTPLRSENRIRGGEHPKKNDEDKHDGQDGDDDDDDDEDDEDDADSDDDDDEDNGAGGSSSPPPTKRSRKASETSTLGFEVVPRGPIAPDNAKGSSSESESDSDVDSDKEKDATENSSTAGGGEADNPAPDEFDDLEDPDIASKARKNRITAELAAMAQKMVSKKGKEEVLQRGYSRHAFNDRELGPEWFRKDEEVHNHPILPVDATTLSKVKEDWKDIDARPIKKILEAKARKRKKLNRKLERTRKHAEALSVNPELNEMQKGTAIQRLYAKVAAQARRQEHPHKKYMVTTRSSSHSVEPKGTASRRSAKGPTVTVRVDRRMKKDKRGEDRARSRRR